MCAALVEVLTLIRKAAPAPLAANLYVVSHLTTLPTYLPMLLEQQQKTADTEQDDNDIHLKDIQRLRTTSVSSKFKIDMLMLS